MGHPGAAVQVPVGALDGTLLAHHQCGEHAGTAPIVHALRDAFADPLARGLHRVPVGAAQTLWPWVARAGAHIAGGAHALLPQPAFAVKAMGVGVAVRAAQAHREAPALASEHTGAGAFGHRRRRAGPGAVEPAQLQQAGQWHRAPVARGRLHHQLEALPHHRALRQRGHTADHLDIQALQARLQRPGREVGGTHAGQAKADQHARTDHHPQAQRRADPPATERGAPGQQAPHQPAHQQQTRAQRAQVDAQRPQPSLLQLQGHTQHTGRQARLGAAPQAHGPHSGPVWPAGLSSPFGARLASMPASRACQSLACESIVFSLPC